MGYLIALIICRYRNRSLWYALWGFVPLGWLFMLFLLEKGPPIPAGTKWYDRPLWSGSKDKLP